MKKNKSLIFLASVTSGIFYSVHNALALMIKMPTQDEIGLPIVSGGIPAVLESVSLWILGIVGSIAVIGFVVSGIQYILASGNEDLMGKGKRNMTYCIIGVVVALSGVIIIKTVDALLMGATFF